MNSNKKVITFIVVVANIHLLLSVCSQSFIDYFPSFKNVNMVSDILEKEKTIAPIPKKIPPIIKYNPETNLPVSDFNTYLKKNTLVRFNADTINPALTKLTDKLIALSEHKNVKIRIAWFGDSQIEGDFITQDLRKMLQNYFGEQKGVGYVPISSVSADFRTTAKLLTNGAISTLNFKNKGYNSGLFLSGYSFFSDDLSIYFSDNIKKNSNQITEKWLLYGKGDSISVKIKDSVRKYPALKNLNRILVGNSTSNNVSFHVAGHKTPIYGVSSEPVSGIVLDNFSFRGITGIELKKINAGLLSEIDKSGYYDLIVVQYGVNLLFKPNDTNYDYYYEKMQPVIQKLKSNMPNTEFLFFSCSDRAFNYEGVWKTAIGIDSLINTQAKLAYENDMAFYNFHESMGGNGAIIKWADSALPLANKDYIHFNFRGANAAAKIIFKALINDYNKAVNLRSKPKAKQVVKPVNQNDSVKVPKMALNPKVPNNIITPSKNILKQGSNTVAIKTTRLISKSKTITIPKPTIKEVEEPKAIVKSIEIPKEIIKPTDSL